MMVAGVYICSLASSCVRPMSGWCTNTEAVARKSTFAPAGRDIYSFRKCYQPRAPYERNNLTRRAVGNTFRSSRSEEYLRRMVCCYKHVAPTERGAVSVTSWQLTGGSFYVNHCQHECVGRWPLRARSCERPEKVFAR